MVGLILNLPWTIIGFLGAILSVPTRVAFNKDPRAIIFIVRSFWWFPVRGAKGITFGNCVLVLAHVGAKYTHHELVHVRQNMDKPLTGKFLYWYELIRKGYWNTSYEIEAYEESDTWPPNRRPNKV